MSRLFSKNYKRTQSRHQAGFTLAEMVTVVAIIVIMTAVILANFPNFRDRSSLELVAQETALIIRQAQSFGTNTRGASFSSVQFPSYGVYFNLNLSVVPSSATSFILFADQDPTPPIGTGPDPNNRYDYIAGCGSSGNECREVYNLQGGITISNLAVCSSSCVSINASHPLNIVFQRPNPEAIFSDESGGNFSGAALCNGPCSYVKITLTSTRSGTTKDIYAWSTGHIYVQ